MSELKDISELQGLYCSIYADKALPDLLGRSCSEKIALVVDLQNPDLGPFKVSECSDDTYILLVDRLVHTDSVYVRSYPLQLVDGIYQINKGMYSGNFVYTTDSRFRSKINAYPISIHDRFDC